MTSTQPRTSATSRIWLVAEREVRARLRSKSFIISTAIMLAIVLAAVIFGGVQASRAADQAAADVSVAVVGDAGAEIQGLPGFETVAAASVDEAEDLVRDGAVDAALVPDTAAGTSGGVRVIADDSAPEALIMALTEIPPVDLLDPPDPDFWLNYFVAYGFGIVFFLAALTFGSTIAQSVVEEKSTRVVEILISAMPVHVLLAGKVIGNSLLAFGQTALIVALAIAGLTATGQGELLAALGAPLVWFVVFFLIGFVLVAAMFAATGAMVSRQEDIGSTTGPVTGIVIAPFMLVIFLFDNEFAMRILSFVPFSSPVGMPVRLFMGTAEWWEPLVSLAILTLTTVGAIALGSKIYRNSLLRMGQRVSLKEALRG